MLRRRILCCITLSSSAVVEELELLLLLDEPLSLLLDEELELLSLSDELDALPLAASVEPSRSTSSESTSISPPSVPTVNRRAFSAAAFAERVGDLAGLFLALLALSLAEFPALGGVKGMGDVSNSSSELAVLPSSALEVASLFCCSSHAFFILSPSLARMSLAISDPFKSSVSPSL
jgi:hypothetical protein